MVSKDCWVSERATEKTTERRSALCVCQTRFSAYNGVDVHILMHELSITQNLLEIALRHAERANARCITRLNLVVGELASIVDDSVQFYWDIVAQGTIAEGAQLYFERVPGALRCLSCNHTFSLDGLDYACPLCGAKQVAAAAGGDEFRLESIEVD